MSRELVVGGSGLVGEHLLAACAADGGEVLGTYLDQPFPGGVPLDMRDGAAVRSLLREVAPVRVFLPAAMPNVDRCEEDPDGSYEVNVLGVENVFEAAREVGARVVFFSSDYVFDGRAGPYSEGDPPRPVGEYGRQKLIGEHLALQRPDTLILRTTVVYGWERQGKNFVARLVRVLSEGGEMRAPADQVGTPTFAPDLARAAVELARAGVRGLVHVAGPDLADRHTFAQEAARAFGLDPARVAAVTTAELGQRAARPLCAGMRVDRAQQLLSFPLRGFRAGLQAMAAERPQ